MSSPRTFDLFAGAGGSSAGAALAGAEIIGGLDRWDVAGETFCQNFPRARHWTIPAERANPREVGRELGEIDLLLASPSCTDHTCAKGAAPRSETNRATAFQVARFAQELNPRWIVLENVVHMRPWKGYSTLLRMLKDALGYNVSEQVLDACDFGVPQKRRRLYVICDREMAPPTVRPTGHYKPRVAADVIEQSENFPFRPLRTAERAAPTLARAERAIASLGRDTPFLIVYYGTDGCGGWQRVDSPLRTVTTLDRFAYVRPAGNGHEMRMLQVPELKRAMGFPETFLMSAGTRRDRVRLLGNGVCPPVMRAIVRKVCKQN